MRIINNIRNYLTEDEFRINIFKDKVNILNYIGIGNFDSSKVIVKHKYGEVKVSGENLIVSKLLNDEILIQGIIKNIEMSWYY